VQKKTLIGDDDDVDSEVGDSLISFDYAALEEAQRLAASQGDAIGDADGAEETGQKRKHRGGCKESHKRRKKERREDDILRAKQAGIHVPSLKEVLAAAAEASCSAESSQKVVPQHGSASQSQSPDIASVSAKEGNESSSTSTQVSLGVAQSEPPAVNAPSLVATASASAVPDAKAEAAAKRVAKEAARRSKIAASVNARTIFITNLPFKVTETEISDWLAECGKVKRVRLSMDKGTSKPLGYAHVQFETSASVDAAISKYDRYDVQGRVVRVARVGKDAKCEFDLPKELKDDIVSLIREAYEGKNISTIKDAWQKRHPGQKLDTHKYGFKNFSSAMKTIEGITLEHHVEKVKTYLAFFTDSDAHKALLEERQRRAAEKVLSVEPSLMAVEGESIDAAQICNGADSVVKAWYGKKDALWSDKGKDVTEKVKELLRTKQPLKAKNEDFGDPLPGRTKALAIKLKAAVPSTTTADGIQEAASV
jgi:hypothetical protein